MFLLENNMNHNINHLQKMKRTFLYSSLFGVGMLFAACAEKSRPDLTLPCQNTIAIESTDTPESIMEKAAHIVPSPMQMEALKMNSSLSSISVPIPLPAWSGETAWKIPASLI